MPDLVTPSSSHKEAEPPIQLHVGAFDQETVLELCLDGSAVLRGAQGELVPVPAQTWVEGLEQGASKGAGGQEVLCTLLELLEPGRAIPGAKREVAGHPCQNHRWPQVCTLDSVADIVPLPVEYVEHADNPQALGVQEEHGQGHVLGCLVVGPNQQWPGWEVPLAARRIPRKGAEAHPPALDQGVVQTPQAIHGSPAL
eukprot:1069645-Lingulodinium_polyedra.AAC.1